MKTLYFLFFAIIIGLNSGFGASYTVVSNADGTPNDGVSLRWAITQAIVNTGPDTIIFNIPGPAPHTITLLSDLPQILGYDAEGTVIDGSTQPANGFAGVSPKIIVDGNDTAYNGLDIQVADCAVYGLGITRFWQNGILLTMWTDFFDTTKANNFRIGAPGKGNVIYNMSTTQTPFTNGIAVGYGYGIQGGVIQSNKIGTDTTGMFSTPMYQGIFVSGGIFDTTGNILIGGSGPGEGNLISVKGDNMGGNIYISSAHTVTMKGNMIGCDKNGGQIVGNSAVTGIYVYAFSDSCTIGGPNAADGNIIAYNEDTVTHDGGGIEVQASDFCLIRRNSIYCNGTWGGIQLIGGNNSYLAPVITNGSTTGISGTASPYDVIELYYDNTGCSHPAHYCSGETYIATVTADALGDWSYTGPLTFTASITGTATDTITNRTSDFAACYTILLVTPPVAALTASDSLICNEAGDCIDFFDHSTNNPTSWKWYFPNAVPDSSVLQNPTNICFNQPGTYSVTLIVTNLGGSDTITIAPAITVRSSPPAPVITLHPGDTLRSSSASTYQWYYNGNPIPGATDSFYVATQSGSYNVFITDSYGCGTLGTPVNVTVTYVGILNETSPIEIFPNPVKNEFVIRCSEIMRKNALLEIENVIGERVYIQQIETVNGILITKVDISSFSKGVYLIRINNGTKEYQAKVVKE